MTGSFSISCEPMVKIKLPKLNDMAHIFASFHVTSQISNYNIIIDQDSLWEFGTTLYFQKNFFGWKEIKILMTPINCKMRTNFAIR